MKDSQYYSKIARKYLLDYSKENDVKWNMVCYGNLDDMEELFDLFGGDRSKSPTLGEGAKYRFKYVIDKLDRESKKPNAIFRKSYISYPGIINKPTRCFVLKENIYDNFTTENCEEEIIKKFAKGLDETIINSILDGALNQSIKDFSTPIDRDKLREIILRGIKPMKVYIVTKPQGIDEDYREEIEKVFLDKEKAEKYVEEENAKLPLEQRDKCSQCTWRYKIGCEHKLPKPDCLEEYKYGACMGLIKYQDVYPLSVDEYEVEE